MLAVLAGCMPTGGQRIGTGDAAFPANLTGLGTEPFWSLTVAGARVTFSRADSPQPLIAPARHASRANGLELTGTLGAKRFRAVFTRKACSDGMSDRTYPLTLQVTLGNEVLNGCAYPAGMTFPPA